jgi:hypothetical protein
MNHIRAASPNPKTPQNPQVEEKLFKNGGPDVHVVAGSCRMNSRSGTNAFRMAVVRRADMTRLYGIFQVGSVQLLGSF